MNIALLKSLQAKATPGKLRIRSHPQIAGDGFIEADTYEGHDYHGCASGFEIAGDEDYPTRKTDMELIVTLWNALVDEEDKLAPKYKKLTSGYQTNPERTCP